MDIPSLLQRSNDLSSSLFFSHVVAWLEGVTDAQRTGPLLDPYTAAHEPRDRDDWTFYNPEPHSYASPAMSSSSSSSYAEPEAWAAPRDRLFSPVASIPSPISHDSCRAPCCHPANWGYVSATPPPPFAYSNPHHPHPNPQPPTYYTPHHPDPRLYSNSVFVLPPVQAQELSQESSDKLQLKLHNIMRQNQMASSRHQWSAANPSLSSAYERSRRSAAAHVTERRRRSVQATPYHKLALPYLAS